MRKHHEGKFSKTSLQKRQGYERQRKTEDYHILEDTKQTLQLKRNDLGWKQNKAVEK